MKSKFLKIVTTVEPLTTSHVRRTIAESRIRILKLLSKNKVEDEDKKAYAYDKQDNGIEIIDSGIVDRFMSR